MSKLLFSIVRLAKHCWDPSNAAALTQNVQQLKLLVDRLTARDLNLPPGLLCNSSASSSPDAVSLSGLAATESELALEEDAPKSKPSSPSSSIGREAPCTYLSLLDHPNVTISIFILHCGSQMPLHDHPAMHGLLKAISGQLAVQGFTAIDAAGEPITVTPHKVPASIPVRCEETVVLDEHSPAVLLTPMMANYHRIGAVDGQAAFLDILSPPYQSEIPVWGARTCTYYKPKLLDGDRWNLVPSGTPTSFWCDMVPYEWGEESDASE